MLLSQKFLGFRMLDHALLDILVCPLCKGRVLYDHANQELICQFDRLAFSIRNHVPVMLESEAREIPLEERK